MDFFGAQEAAKKRTFWSLLLFALGVVATALVLYAVIVWSLFARSDQLSFDLPLRYAFAHPHIFLLIIGGVMGVILLASIYKIAALNEGGTHIADSVGARMIDPTTTDEAERRLLNVVEEMSLASGYGTPSVAVLDDEPNINAFAAACTPRDAVVVVTRGALDNLTRDELQAVIGHEFSHLLNGDSKININIAGWIFGLFFLTIIGRMFMQVRDRKGNGLAILGVAIFVIGLVGYFFGRIIQALISRQREFLADASSVQFTRNPPAMVSTLAKLRSGSTIQHHSSSSLAHFFFGASSVVDNFAGFLATHPPIEARMKAIDANYENNLAPLPEEKPAAPVEPQQNFIPTAQAFSPENATAAMSNGASLIGLIAATGSLSRRGIKELSNAVDDWPAPVQQALSIPEGCQAILLGLALSGDNRQECLLSLQKNNQVSPAVFRLLFELETTLEQFDVKHRLVLAQMAAGRIKNIAESDRIQLGLTLEAIIAFDGKLTAFEALYTEFIRHALALPADEKPMPPEEAASRVLSFLYIQRNQTENAATLNTQEFDAVLQDLILPTDKIRLLKYVPTSSLREALPSLLDFSFLQRRELLIALGRVMKLHEDANDADEEIETLRLLAALMDCPMPARVA